MNAELLEALYRRYAQELQLYLFTLCRSAPLCEDLLQEVFLKALLSLDDRHGNFRAWLYQVARNTCFTAMKKAARAKPDETAQDVPAPEDALSTLLRGEEQRRLYAAILALPPVQRQIIVMQYFSGLSQAEIGRVMSMSHGAVRTAAHRAREALRQHLQDYHK